jgi:hypothetical protein
MVQEQVSSILDEKLSELQEKISNIPVMTARLNAKPSMDTVDSKVKNEKWSINKDASDSWSPGYSSALHQLDKTHTLTRALTRSHSIA